MGRHYESQNKPEPAGVGSYLPPPPPAALLRGASRVDGRRTTQLFGAGICEQTAFTCELLLRRALHLFARSCETLFDSFLGGTQAMLLDTHESTLLFSGRTGATAWNPLLAKERTAVVFPSNVAALLAPSIPLPAKSTCRRIDTAAVGSQRL